MPDTKSQHIISILFKPVTSSSIFIEAQYYIAGLIFYFTVTKKVGSLWWQAFPSGIIVVATVAKTTDQFLE